MNPNLDRIIILADDSADWKIAGLRQLDRLVLALNEFAKSGTPESTIDIIVLWKPGIPMEQRWQPRDGRLTHCRFVERFDASPGHERVFNTRLLVKRNGLEEFVRDSVPLDLDQRFVNESRLWQELWRIFEGDCQRATKHGRGWRYISERGDIPRFERWLLRGSGKPRDGFVSRYLNRPISRTVSQFLLKTSMTPNLWTVLITAFPLIGFLFLIRGTYPGFVIGALLFNVHSILDGCDGEIARAKYLDSETGPGVDAFGDLIALLLFSLGLGFGLSRSAQQDAVSQWVFLSEGVLTLVFIALRLGPDHVIDLFRRGPAAVVYSKNDDRLRRSGGRVFGDRFTSWAFELTKRDVVFLAFLIGAALGLARWTLHLLFVYALATLILSWYGRARAAAERR